MTALPNCLCIGTGEYTTGYVCSVGQRDGEVTQSDKRCGVVALVMFDLRARGQVRSVACGNCWRDLNGVRRLGLASAFVELRVSSSLRFVRTFSEQSATSIKGSVFIAKRSLRTMLLATHRRTRKHSIRYTVVA